MDFQTLVNSFATGNYTVTRTARGSNTYGGIYQPGAVTTISVQASVSQAKGADLKKLPEGRRTNNTICIFTTSLLQLGGQLGPVDSSGSFEADRIAYNGSVYELAHLETWQDSLTGSFCYKALAVNVQ